MSVTVKGTTITMTRGDTFISKINIKDANGNEYIPAPTDAIRFALKERYSDEEPLFVKEIPSDTCVLRIESEDTKELEMPKKYVYDIQITYGDGIVDTFIPKGILLLKEEVY